MKKSTLTDRLYNLDIWLYKRIKFFTELEDKKGLGYCNILNKTFAEEFNRTPVSISRSISKLIKLGYINNIGNRQFRRLVVTDKDFNNLDKIINNDDKVINNLDKPNIDNLITAINNLDKEQLTIVINRINNLDKQIIEILIKKFNIDNNKKTIVKKDKPFFDDTLAETQFEEFWKYYTPIKCNNKFVAKGNKKTTKEKFIKALKQGATYEEIITGLGNYLKYCRTNNQLTKNATTFINNRCWEEDYSDQETVNSKSISKHNGQGDNFITERLSELGMFGNKDQSDVWE